MRKLPVLTERVVRAAETSRASLRDDFERDLQFRASDAKMPVTCSKGCHHCCYHPVLASPLEGVTLYRWLSEEGLWTRALKTALQEHHVKTMGLDYTVWLLSMTPCPFLSEEGTCGIYNKRPLSCQVTYSIGDPHYCHPHRFGEGTGLVSKVDTLKAELATEKELLKQHRAKTFRLPLSTALLLGEGIAKGDIELGDIGHQVWQKWTETT